MSCPRVFPAGNDRSWTREFYYTINRISRRLWYENNCDQQVEQALQDMVLYGKGYVEVR